MINKINTDKITYSVKDIIVELKKCLVNEHNFYFACVYKTIYIPNDINWEIHHKNILKKLSILMSLIDKQLIKTDLNINHLKTLVNIFESEFKDINLNKYESSVYKWKDILPKIKYYIIECIPFSIYNIRQTNTVDNILESLDEVLLKDINFHKLNLKKDHGNNHERITKINNCFIISFQMLRTKINEIKIYFREKSKFNNLNESNKLEKLEEINNLLYEYYQSLINNNEFLKLENMHKLNNINETMQCIINLKSKYHDICGEIRKYLYYKNFSKYKGVASIIKYKTIKCSLKSITNRIHFDKINNVVLDVNKIIDRGYMFIKLYLIYCY